MNRALVLVFALVFAGPACAAVAGLDQYNAVDCVEPQCTASDTGLADAGDTEVVDSAVVDSAGDSIADADAPADTVVDTNVPDVPPPVCTPIAPSAVALGSWSIDATEVTNAQYAAFIAAKGADTAGQPAYCAWNLSFVPTVGYPAPAARCNHPVVNIDWCDAYAYCKWAGKRLCGNPSGGPAPYDGANATSSQWSSACSRAGTSRYIYGATYITRRCVDDQYDGKAGIAATDVAQPVKGAGSCRGDTAPYDALYDLNGNVAEWEDRCKDAKGGDDDCRTRGGSYGAPWDHADCAEEEHLKRKEVRPDVGFRCCSP